MTSSCTSVIPDCPINTVLIGDLCFDLGYLKNKSCATYRESSVSLADQSDNIMGKYLVESPLECVMKCNANMECKAVSFEYGDSLSKRGDESESGGVCTMSRSAELLKEPIDLLPKSQDPKYACATTYLEEKKGSSPCVNVISRDGSKLTNIGGVPHDSSTIPSKPRISCGDGGAYCRDDIVQNFASLNADPSNKSLLSLFGNWCKKNPDTLVCNQFCANLGAEEYCQNRYPVTFIILIAVTLLLIFLMVLSSRTKLWRVKWSKILTICGFVAAIVTTAVFAAYHGYQYFNAAREYNGKSQPFSGWNRWVNKDPCWFEAQKETDSFGDVHSWECKNSCKSLFGNCECQTDNPDCYPIARDTKYTYVQCQNDVYANPYMNQCLGRENPANKGCLDTGQQTGENCSGRSPTPAPPTSSPVPAPLQSVIMQYDQYHPQDGWVYQQGSQGFPCKGGVPGGSVVPKATDILGMEDPSDACDSHGRVFSCSKGCPYLWYQKDKGVIRPYTSRSRKVSEDPCSVNNPCKNGGVCGAVYTGPGGRLSWEGRTKCNCGTDSNRWGKHCEFSGEGPRSTNTGYYKWVEQGGDYQHTLTGEFC